MTTIHYNVPGSKRKELVKAIAAWSGIEFTYAGAPTFAYHAGGMEIDRDGNLKLLGTTGGEAIERLMQHLDSEGFECDLNESEDEEAKPTAEEPTTETVDNESEGTISIRIPHSTMSEATIENLKALIEAKKHLIIPALGSSRFLPICWNDEGCIDFPWLPSDTDSDTIRAWTQFISKLCEMARNAKRVTAKEKETANPKYEFRCFLLRLGFIGDEYKADRKILLKNLSGSSAFKGGAKNAVSE